MAELAEGIAYHVVNTLGWPALRPLQREAIAPVRAGHHALLLAPTAGGKTEAAFLPLLSEMSDARWPGLSVIYVTPLRALLNNLHPRLSAYAGWVGRRVGLWHGDVGSAERNRILRDPPEVLLTTPESLEAMLVSTRVDHEHLFAGLRAVVVDELHAFAGDDRGWHLLAVLERLQRLAGRPLQRVGMTATVGNPEELLGWLTRGAGGVVVAPEAAGPAGEADIALDFVGSEANAAKVIDLLHPGEKRLAFCGSRAQAEKLAAELRTREVPTVVSHSSLSADERRHAERTFAEASECVVVATSTLELGVDIGDLDRVIQIDAPNTVASFLQRLGRTGRRAGSRRNMVFLATTDAGLVQSAALLRLWESGFVEPVVPTPTPWHIAAQQLLALGLQEGRFALEAWRQWWPGLQWMTEARPVLQHLLDEGFLGFDAGFAIVGPESERVFGRRNFMELTSVFTAAPEFRVLHGRDEVGTVSPLALSSQLPPGVPRVLSLGGRGWQVSHVDWGRRQVFVTSSAGRGRSVWQGGSDHMGYELAQSINAVLGGGDPEVALSTRAADRLALIRESGEPPVALSGGSVLQRSGTDTRWWTYAGSRANAALVTALRRQGVEATAGSLALGIKGDVTPEQVSYCAESLTLPDAVERAVEPSSNSFDGVEPGYSDAAVDVAALSGLKFSSLLPERLALEALSARMADPIAAVRVLASPVRLAVPQRP